MSDEDFDVALLRAFQNADPVAFDRIYRRHAAAVFRYAWSLARTRSEADDLLQETFLTFWSKRRTIQLVDESVLPWLLVTCRNHALNLRRRQARRREVPLEELRDAVSGDGSDLLWMREALTALTPADRQVCELCLVQGMTYRQAAQLLGATEAAVGKRLQRARERLRKEATENA